MVYLQESGQGTSASRTAVPNLFGTRDWFWGRPYSHELGSRGIISGWFKHIIFLMHFIVQSLSCAQLLVAPWTAACQASLSFTVSQSLHKIMAIELVMLSNHLILCCLLLLQSFPASGSFSMSQLFASDSQSIGAAASWFPLGLTGLISLLSKGLSRVFYSTTVQKLQFFGAQPSSWASSHIHTLLEKPYLWL